MTYNHTHTEEISLDIRQLYPGLTNEELQQMQEFWDRYLEIVVRIGERQENIGPEKAIQNNI